VSKPSQRSVVIAIGGKFNNDLAN